MKKADREKQKAEDFIQKLKEQALSRQGSEKRGKVIECFERCEFTGERAVDGMWGLDHRCVLAKGHDGLCRWKN